MIPEPFTYAIAGFGVTMALIGAAATVLESSKQRIDKFREYKTRLQQLESEVRLSELKFDDCMKGWRDDKGDLIRLEDCVELFGSRYCDDMGKTLSLVIIALAKLQQMVFFGLECTDSLQTNGQLQALELRAGPAYEDAWTWMSSVSQRQVLAATSTRKNWKQNLRVLLSQRFKFLVRVKFTMWDGETINKRVEALRKAIDNFRELTNLLSNNIPKLAKDDRDTHEPTLATQITRLVRINRRWKDLQSVMGVVSGTPFAVLPRQPDDEGHTDCIRKGDDVTTSMLVEKFDDNGHPARGIVYVSCEAALKIPSGNLAETTLTGQCKGEVSSVLVSCPKTQGKVLKRLHESVARQPADIRRKLERLWELERTETAVSLINWTLLLWATPWSVCVCTARLWRYPVVGGGARISMMPCAAQCHKDTCSFEIQVTNAQPEPAESLRVREHYFRPTPTHQDVRNTRRTLMSLAITLCEVALLRPIELGDTEEQPLIFHCGEGQELTISDLLDRVEDAMTKPYRAATQKCFDFATASICNLTAAADIIAFSNAVLIPLTKWKADVVDRRDGTGVSRRWYLQVPAGTVNAVEI